MGMNIQGVVLLVATLIHSSVSTQLIYPTHKSLTSEANVQTRLLGADLLLACVGSSHASMSLREDWRNQLRKTQREIGFHSIRFHGLFDDDMSTYLKGGPNMFNVFSSFDLFVDLDLQPIVELSFMPRELASAPQNTTFHYQGGISAPKDWDAWGTFIKQVVQAMVDRYGLKEVLRWRFEVWNEPNCGFLSPTNGCCEADSCGPQALYFKLYNYTARAVKSVNSNLRVGGPATAQVGWLPSFLKYIQANDVPCDFLSTHLYPTDPNVEQNRGGFAKTIFKAEATAKSVGLPLTITEFNAGLGINAADGPYAPSFVIHQLVEFQQSSVIDTLSFWTFTDIFEEGGLVSAPYSQQFGMLNVHSVPKPIYRLFEWLGEIEKTAHTVIDIGSSNNFDYVTVSSPIQDRTRYTSLVTNFDVYPNHVPMISASIRFSGLRDPTRVPKHAYVRILDSTHGYARRVWEEAGKPMYPSRDEIEKEMEASRVPVQQLVLTKLSADTYHVQFNLEAYACAQVQFDY